MGITTGILAGISGGISIGSGILGATEAAQEEKARVAALKLRMTEIEDSTRQQKIGQLTNINKTLAAQETQSAATGNGMEGTSSVNILSLDDINNFAQDINADNLSEVFQKEGVESEIQAAYRQGTSQEISSVEGGFEQAFSTGANMYFKSPTPSSVTTNNAIQPQPSPAADAWSDARKSGIQYMNNQNLPGSI